MSTPVDEKPAVDLRTYLAEERTFLAWIRTGVALMGFGVLLARFGIFGDGPHVAPQVLGLQPHRISLWLAAALISVGVAASLSSARRYMRLTNELKRGELVRRTFSMQGLIVALSLALLGIAMVIYLISDLA
jgi:putative membrane protein